MLLPYGNSWRTVIKRTMDFCEAFPGIFGVSLSFDNFGSEGLAWQAVYVLAHFFAPFIPIAAEAHFLPFWALICIQNSAARRSLPKWVKRRGWGDWNWLGLVVSESFTCSESVVRPIPELRDDFQNLTEGKEAFAEFLQIHMVFGYFRCTFPSNQSDNDRFKPHLCYSASWRCRRQWIGTTTWNIVT